MPDVYNLDTKTMLQALNFNGGAGQIAAARTLLRSAVAALLNAASPDVSYPLTEAEIIADVNTALASDRNAMLTLATELDMYNNLGCPLN
ncbi:MAG: hypothetical protein KA314_04430 [Chloroflexi bacterium]|nr:hypothetical protein [Chloroflexota bacterium]